MDTILYYICVPLGYLMKWCWQLIGNYGLAIILFTLATKLVLIPLSVWIQKNSIKMVKIQPGINFIKANHFGDTDTIAEEQTKLFKREKYHPMLSLVPLALQIILLLGVIQIIYHPMSYLFGFSDGVINALAEFVGADTSKSSFQLAIIDAVKNGSLTEASAVVGVDAATLSSVVKELSSFRLGFLGFSLSEIPSEVLGIYFAVPLFAALSSLALSFAQNRSNVLQHEQGNVTKYGLTAFSVGLSLFLGFFVPTGIALYWSASNLLAIAQLYILNACINPKKYVDYEALEKSRKALADIKALEAPDKRDEEYKKNKQREKEDYKRFFKIVNKHFVIYSEKSGFYKYYKDLLSELTKRSNITVHYITNDPKDIIFEVAKENSKIQPYYIGIKKTIPLMMRMESDIVAMTTPDLGKYYIKRSFMKKDIEYIYLPHGLMSMHTSLNEGAFDEFDTIFCAGPHIKREMQAIIKARGLSEKNLVEFGYPLSDDLEREGKKAEHTHAEGERYEILIAPTWNEDNILDSCIDTLIEKLYSDRYHITVRPHPEYTKRFSAKLKALTERYADRVGEGLTFELDFSKNHSIYSSDLIITDWSGVGPEFAFATGKPCIFINTKYKCLNPNWKELNITPVEISLREKLGISLEKSELSSVDLVAEELLANSSEWKDRIEAAFNETVYNRGNAAAVGARYILSSLVAKKK